MDVSVGPQRRLSDEELVFFTVVLEKILESSLDCKKIQPVHPKGDQSWVFTGRTDVKVKDDSEKAGLKLDIQKTNTMASSPITSL